MNKDRRKVGRPPSQATIDKRQQQNYWSARPSHLRQRHTQTPTLGETWLKTLEEMEERELKPFRHGRWAPNSHAYAMFAMLEGGTPAERVQTLLSADETYKIRATRRRKDGGWKTKLKSDRRREALFKINAVLIKKLGTSTYSPNKVAGIIHDQWETMTDAQRLRGEPASMTRRGDGGAVLSAGHIARWLRELMKEVRQGLLL